MTPERRNYILEHLRKYQQDNWIRISTIELHEFGGSGFFAPGCKVEYINDKVFTTQPGTRGWTKSERVQLPWRITAPPEGGWFPGWTPGGYYMTTTTSTNGTITLTNTLVSGKRKEKETMREHHINRDTLLGVVRENKDRYATVYARFKALYADEIESLTQKHLDGKIAVNQITVKDKDGNGIIMLADMSSTYDDQLRELELDSREDVILDHEEYSQYVLSYATNFNQIEATARKLEELT